MSDFKDFIDQVEQSPTQSLPSTGLTLTALQMNLSAATLGLLTPFSFSSSEKDKFANEVSSLTKDKAFISELSNQIDKPLDSESEDEFVKRSSDKLRQLLYKKFNIKS